MGKSCPGRGGKRKKKGGTLRKEERGREKLKDGHREEGKRRKKEKRKEKEQTEDSIPCSLTASKETLHSSPLALPLFSLFPHQLPTYLKEGEIQPSSKD